MRLATFEAMGCQRYGALAGDGIVEDREDAAFGARKDNDGVVRVAQDHGRKTRRRRAFQEFLRLHRVGSFSSVDADLVRDEARLVSG